jgi:hypothetical protein
VALDAGKRNRLEMLVGIGLVGVSGLLLLAYFVFVYGPSLEPRAMIAPPVPAGELVDLRDAYGRANAVAQAEAGDAQLVSASTQWQAASEETLLAGTDAWLFVFHSPGSSHVLDVVVSTDEAWVANQTRVWVAPEALAEGAWQAEPRDALQVFLAYGGREFLGQHPQAVVNLHLAESEEESPVWTIAALDPADRSLLSLAVNAETRQVLSVGP